MYVALLISLAVISRSVHQSQGFKERGGLPRVSTRPIQFPLTSASALVRDARTLPKRWENSRSMLPLSGETYSFQSSIRRLQSFPRYEFDEMFEVHVNLNLNLRRSDHSIRGLVQYPHPAVKRRVVYVLSDSDAERDAAYEAGADVVHGGSFIRELEKTNKVPFDILICSPLWMPRLSKLGRLLGPKGLMPSVRIGTLCDDVAGAVRTFRSETAEIKSDTHGLLHAGIGMVTRPVDEVKANLQALVRAICEIRPDGVKGRYIKKATLSTTMGPGYPLAPGDIDALAKGGGD